MPHRLPMLLLLAGALLAPMTLRAQAQPHEDTGDNSEQATQNGLVATPPANLSVHALCEAHANTLFDALDSAHYDAASTDFDAALRARYPATKLKQDYEALPSEYGKMMGRGRPHTGEMGGHTVVMAPMIFERGTVTAEVRCNGEGVVSDLRLLPTQVMKKP